MNLGLLDLPAPLWDAIDGALEALGLPAVARIALYAGASAWVSMAIYRRTSRQSELQALATESRALRAELAGYDGEFDGLMQRVRRLMRLSARHLGLSLWPALLGGLPLLFVLPWLSNTYSTLAPAPGALVQIVPEQIDVPAEALTWRPRAVARDAESGGWRVPWPDAAEPQQLVHGDEVVLSLPLQAPVTIVHRRLPWLNLLIANPAGYLPDSSPVGTLRLGLPERELVPWGPGWLRGWPAPYFIVLIAASLVLRWRWRLQ